MEVEQLNQKLSEETAIVDRVWKAIGISRMAEANGKAIDELVADLKRRAEHWERLHDQRTEQVQAEILRWQEVTDCVDPEACAALRKPIAALNKELEAAAKTEADLNHYRTMIDLALNSPRDLVPGQKLLSQHLTAIGRLASGDPEFDGTDAAHPAWWRGHDHTTEVFCQLVNEIIDGKEVDGVAAEPWEATRRRIAALNSRVADNTSQLISLRHAISQLHGEGESIIYCLEALAGDCAEFKLAPMNVWRDWAKIAAPALRAALGGAEPHTGRNEQYEADNERLTAERDELLSHVHTCPKCGNYCKQCACWNEELAAVTAERDRLENERELFLGQARQQTADLNRLLTVIMEVHSQHADDLCWQPADVNKIFAAAGLPPQDLRVGDKAAMRRNCDRYIDALCDGGPWVSYAELESRLADARTANDTLAKQIARQAEEAAWHVRSQEMQYATAKSVWADHEGQFAEQQARIATLESELDPPVCSLQFPDGTVPGNVREAAEGWKWWYDDALATCKRMLETTRAAL